jgi:neuronal cell adhesion protein
MSITNLESTNPDFFFFVKFCRYTWEKNGKPYDWQVYDDRISQQPGRGTLVITSPRDEDIGKFSSNVNNQS